MPPLSNGYSEDPFLIRMRTYALYAGYVVLAFLAQSIVWALWVTYRKSALGNLILLAAVAAPVVLAIVLPWWLSVPVGLGLLALFIGAMREWDEIMRLEEAANP